MTTNNTQPAQVEVAIRAKKSDLDILTWMQNMIPNIQDRLGRKDQNMIRLEWTKDGEVLCTALYDEAPAPTAEQPLPANPDNTNSA